MNYRLLISRVKDWLKSSNLRSSEDRDGNAESESMGRSTKKHNNNRPSHSQKKPTFKTKCYPIMNWDERRQLIQDILKLAPADLPGVYLRLYQSKTTQIHEIRREDPIYMDSIIEFGQLDGQILHELRKYVDSCYVPQFVQPRTCNICEGMWSNSPVIACGNDYCTTAIHEDCYGVLIRDSIQDPWYCPSCASGYELQCMICLQKGGALKRTTDGRWAHALCVLVIPETTLRDVPTLEPVDGAREINNSRSRFLCALCKNKGGACMVCENEDCNVGLHPKCAADAGYLLGSALNPLALYCDKHLPSDRVDGAKRWISEDDCIADLDDESQAASFQDKDMNDYEFVRETTVFDKVDFDTKAITRFASDIDNAISFDTTPKDIPVTISYAKPALAMAIPTSFPTYVATKSAASHAEVSSDFPVGRDLVGAIVEVYWKQFGDWFGAEVLEWSSRNRNHLLQYFKDGHEQWFRMRPHNTRILYLASDHDRTRRLRVKLHRVTHNGVRQWRIRPKKF